MSNGKAYKGSCFCGAVQFTVSGEPAAMGYCHCESCRSWSAGPVNAFTLWKPDAVKFTRGADLHRASRHGTHRRVCGKHSGFSVPRRRPCQLSGDKAPNEGRAAEDEGRSEGNGRLRRQLRGITTDGPLAAPGRCLEVAIKRK